MNHQLDYTSNIFMNYGQYLLSELEKLGWTMKKIAGFVHISESYLSNVKRGKKPASPLLLVRLGYISGDFNEPDFVDKLIPDEVVEEIDRINALHSLLIEKQNAAIKTSNEEGPGEFDGVAVDGAFSDFDWEDEVERAYHLDEYLTAEEKKIDHQKKI